MKDLKVSDVKLMLEKLCDEAESCNYADFRGTTDERNSCQDRFDKTFDEIMMMVSGIIEENKRMREALTSTQSDIKSIIDHLFSIGLDEAWVICKLNDMLDDVSYGLNGK